MSQDGTSYLTGYTIAGQHCGGCGRPGRTKDRWSNGMWDLAQTPCCSRLPCYGYVTTTPWIGRETSREVWACCRGEAERRLGEGAYLDLEDVRS